MSTRNLRNIERTRTAAQVRGHQRAEGSLRHVAEWLRTVTERAKADRLDVIEREVAHAVAIERERVARILAAEAQSNRSAAAFQNQRGSTCAGAAFNAAGLALEDAATAIRNGAHDGGAR